MYNRCDSCGRHLENYEDRRLILDSTKRISTSCLSCYNKVRAIRRIV